MKQRSTFIKDRSALEIHIEMYKNWWMIIINGFIFLIILSGATELPQMFRTLFTKFPGPIFIPMLFVVLGISAFLSWAYIFLWNTFGKEIITITPGELRIKNDIFGLGWCRRFYRRGIVNLRSEKIAMSVFDPKALIGLAGGIVAFDYKEKSYRFGIQLDAEEAQMVIGKIKSFGIG